MIASSKQQPKVYSYIRFSSPEQEWGDSERRQMAEAELVAKQRGLTLDETFKDKGISARRGKNRKKGSLGSFLKGITDGKVVSGSILVVENTDRLSREDPLTALEVVTGILRNGVTIITALPAAEYNRESLKGGLIYLLVGQIQVAYDESEKKSRRISAAWDANRKQAVKDGTPFAGQTPHWIKIIKEDDTKRFELVKEAVPAYQKLFELRLAGWGIVRIAKELNSGKYWAPPKHKKRASGGWRDSYITKVLRNNAVIGELQPMREIDGKRVPVGELLKDFYPVLIKPDIFYRVQKLLDTRAAAVGRGGGRIATFPNILRNIAVCAYCGGPMHHKNRRGNVWRGFKYLECHNSIVKSVEACKTKLARTIRFDEVEALILESLPNLKPEQILPARSDSEREVAQLKGAIESLQGERDILAKQRLNLMEQIKNTSSQRLRNEYEAEVVRIDQKTSDSEQQEAKIVSSLTIAEKDSRSVHQWQQGMSQLVKLVSDPERSDVRERLNHHLKEFIEKIEVFSEGYLTTEPPESIAPKKKYKKGETRFVDAIEPRRHDDFEAAMLDVLRDTDSPLLENPKYLSFLTYLQDLRMSRKGRFLRIWFKSGLSVDLVPPKSFASGMRYIKEAVGIDEEGFVNDGWQVVGPDIADRWRIYKNRPKYRAPRRWEPNLR